MLLFACLVVAVGGTLMFNRQRFRWCRSRHRLAVCTRCATVVRRDSLPATTHWVCAVLGGCWLGRLGLVRQHSATTPLQQKKYIATRKYSRHQRQKRMLHMQRRSC